MFLSSLRSRSTFLKMIILLLVMVCLVMFRIGLYYACLFQPMLHEGQSSIFFEIEPNTSAQKLIQQLNDRHLVSSNCPLLSFMRAYSYTQRLKAGIYRITAADTPYHFIQRVVAGDVLVQSFKIIEGTTLEDLKQSMRNAPFLQFNEIDLMQFSQGHISPEGLFLAETYQYPAPSKADRVLRKANQLLMNYLNHAFETRNLDVPYRNPYELLIAASIIEKETARLEERNIISGIIVNRLRLHMPLQMDPTLIYGLHKTYGQRLRHEDIRLDTPYNTYKRRGLPPTPIAFVGRASIDAAAHPVKTDYLYYVAKGDGTHQFSTSYQEQRAAIQRIKSGS